MNIAILNLQEIEELNYTLDCLQFIDAEIIDAQIDIFTGYDLSEQVNNTYINHIFPLYLKDLSFNDISIKYSQIRAYAKLGKYHIAVDTECTLRSAIVTYFLSGRTAGFKKAGLKGYFISKLYDEVIPYDATKEKRELTFELLAKTFGFDTKRIQSKNYDKIAFKSIFKISSKKTIKSSLELPAKLFSKNLLIPLFWCLTIGTILIPVISDIKWDSSSAS